MAVKWYRPGRYYWRGPKRGTEEADCVEVPAGRGRSCRHVMLAGLDARFAVCADRCGMAQGPMSLPGARAVADALRAKPAAIRTETERALIAFADHEREWTL